MYSSWHECNYLGITADKSYVYEISINYSTQVQLPWELLGFYKINHHIIYTISTINHQHKQHLSILTLINSAYIW